MTLLGIFAKEPVPGRVKTRLATEIGNQAAAEFYAAMTDHIIDQLHHLADETVLCFAPATAQTHFHERYGSRCRLMEQCEGDLGTRQRHFFEQAFTGGADRVIVIGTDSPLLSPAELQGAFDALLWERAVIGPAADGGYYLLGFSEAAIDCFADVPWSTDGVFSAIVSNLGDKGIQPATLDAGLDVDDLPSLRAIQQQFVSNGTVPYWVAKAIAASGQRD